MKLEGNNKLCQICLEIPVENKEDDLCKECAKMLENFSEYEDPINLIGKE